MSKKTGTRNQRYKRKLGQLAGRTEWKTVGVPVTGELVVPDLNDPWSELAELLPVVLQDLDHL